MSRLFFLALFAVLSAGLVQSHVITEFPDQDGQCLQAASQEIVILDTTQASAARRCYVGASSVIQLRCDWQNHLFELTINGSRRSDERILSEVDENDQFGRVVGGLRPKKTSTDGAACPAPWNEQKALTQQHFGFLVGGELQPQLTVVAGKLYYKKTVYLTEYIDTDDCTQTMQHNTRIDLSCCAEPLPAVVAPVVTAPLVGECTINDCLNTNFGCECAVIHNSLVVKINTTGGMMIPADVGYQLVHLSAKPAASTESFNSPITLFPVSDSTGLGVQQCSDNYYASQNFVIAGHQDKPLELNCDIKYCAKTPANVTPERPLCSAPAAPKPAYCPASR